MSETAVRNKRNRGRITSPGIPVTVFLLFVVLRALVSPYSMSMDWVRDLVPFLYAIVAFLSATTYAKCGPQGQAKTMRLL